MSMAMPTPMPMSMSMSMPEWTIQNGAGIICAGLACVDMQLNNATGGDGGEGIETFQGEKSVGGGSVSMACKTLAKFCHGAECAETAGSVQPVVRSIAPLCKVGNDDTGNKLLSLLDQCGVAARNVNTEIMRAARLHDKEARTALSVLPIYRDGRRGCFFDAASNATFSTHHVSSMLKSLSGVQDAPTTYMYGAFLFGYPHLLPMLQGQRLAEMLVDARSYMEDGGIIALDLNGVTPSKLNDNIRTQQELASDVVIGAALGHVDLLHMNHDELQLLTGCSLRNTTDSTLEDERALVDAVNVFLQCGVAVVAVTRGKQGSYVACNNKQRFQKSPMLPQEWAGQSALLPAAELKPNTLINTNGAGDSFTSGLLLATMLRRQRSTSTAETPSSQSTGATPLDDETSSSVFDTASNVSMASFATSSSAGSATTGGNNKKALTPYTLYMRENYMMLKKQCNNDKIAMFSQCHEMWENESEEVKTIYKHKVAAENKKKDDKTNAAGPEQILGQTSPTFTSNSLPLEAAVHLASLVAAQHIDISTRDLVHVDVGPMIQEAIHLESGMSEI